MDIFELFIPTNAYDLTISTNKDRKLVQAVQNYIGQEIKVMRFLNEIPSNDKNENHNSKTKQTKNQNCFKILKGQKTPQKPKQSNKYIDLDQYGEKTLGMGPHIPAFMLRSSKNKDD